MRRLAFALAFFAAYVVWLELAAAFVITPPRAIHDLWYGPAPIFVGVAIAVVVGLVVNRVIVLAVPFVAVAINGVLNASDIHPWHEVAPAIGPGWTITLLFGIAAGVGLLVRRIDDAMRRRTLAAPH